MQPQRKPPTEDVNPTHKCEHCEFISPLLQHPEFCVYDLQDGVGIMEFWDVIRLPSDMWRCEGCKKPSQAARVPLLRRKVQLDVHVEGCGQGKEVVKINYAGTSVGPDMRQVEDLERKSTGVTWEGTGDCEIERVAIGPPFGCYPTVGL